MAIKRGKAGTTLGGQFIGPKSIARALIKLMAPGDRTKGAPAPSRAMGRLMSRPSPQQESRAHTDLKVASRLGTQVRALEEDLAAPQHEGGRLSTPQARTSARQRLDMLRREVAPHKMAAENDAAIAADRDATFAGAEVPKDDQLEAARAAVARLQAAAGGGRAARKMAARRAAPPKPASPVTSSAPEPLSTDPAVRAVQVENRVRAAYRATANEAGWTMMARLRRSLDMTGLSRNEVDATLDRMIEQPDVRLQAELNQKVLTAADRAAAVMIGPEPRDIMHIGDPSPRPLPAAGPRSMSDLAEMVAGGELSDEDAAKILATDGPDPGADVDVMGSFSGHSGRDVTDEEERNFHSYSSAQQGKILERIRGPRGGVGLAGTAFGSHPPAEAVSPERQAEIRAAIEDIATRMGDRVGSATTVSIQDVREGLAGRFPRGEVDKVIQTLNRTPDWDATPEVNQKALTPRARLAAVVIGNEDKHAIRIHRRGQAEATSLSAPSADPAARAAEVESAIRQTYRDVQASLPAGANGTRSDRVPIRALRARLSGYPQAEVDEMLRSLARNQRGDVFLETQDDQKKLTPEDRATALRMGNRDMHFLVLDPTGRPGVAPAAAPDADVELPPGFTGGLADDDAFLASLGRMEAAPASARVPSPAPAVSTPARASTVDTRPPKTQVVDAYSEWLDEAAREPGAIMPLSELRRRLPGLTRAQQDDVFREMNRSGLTTLSAERNASSDADRVVIGGDARNGFATDSLHDGSPTPPDPERPRRRAPTEEPMMGLSADLARLARGLPGAGSFAGVKLIDVRRALAQRGMTDRREQDRYIRNAVSGSHGLQLIPEMDQLQQPDAERAAQLVFAGGRKGYLIVDPRAIIGEVAPSPSRVDAPAVPAPVPAKKAAAKLAAAKAGSLPDIAAAVRSSANLDDARQHLSGLTVGQLRELAKTEGIPFRGSTKTKPQMVDDIVEVAIGGRVHLAEFGDSGLATTPEERDAKRARAIASRATSGPSAEELRAAQRGFTLSPDGVLISGPTPGPSARKTAAQKLAASAPTESPTARLARLGGLASREAVLADLASAKKPELLAMARQLSVPRAAKLTIAELRQAIAQSAVGRRLDSIAIRGFTGLRP